MSILTEIYAHKRAELQAAQARRLPGKLEEEALAAPTPLDFKAALLDARYPTPRLIAEVKRRSPSRGTLKPGLEPLALARIYARSGARAISILTDRRYFGGSLDHLRAVSSLNLGLPLLRKDFIFDREQLLEARAAGASAVLLIAAMLSADQLATLMRAAEALSLTPLVEVHNQEEAHKALQAGSRVVGINHRDLHTFDVRLETTVRVRPTLPDGVVVVAESGIRTPADVARLADAGVDAILVGEALVTAEDPGARTRALSGMPVQAGEA